MPPGKANRSPYADDFGVAGTATSLAQTTTVDRPVVAEIDDQAAAGLVGSAERNTTDA
jgi:hypothetical protein